MTEEMQAEPPQQPTWAVVSTMDEPAPLILAFATHYLSIGASELHLFLDDADAETAAALAALPNCHVTLCDRAYWRGSRIGRRPKLHTGRQAFNANLAYARTGADWLLHVDADEFIRDAGGVVAELATAPAGAMYMRLLMAERVGLAGQPAQAIFDGVFRRALGSASDQIPQVYGALGGFFRGGVTGHIAGKAFVRTNAGLEMALHAPRGKQPHRVLRSTRLLHFDGLTRLHYTIKMLRRAHEPEGPGSNRHGASRVTQFQSLRETVADTAHREALITMLKELQPEQVVQLRELALLDEQPFDLSPALAAYGIETDLSCARFDRHLRQRYRKFLREVAPDLLEPDLERVAFDRVQPTKGDPL